MPIEFHVLLRVTFEGIRYTSTHWLRFIVSQFIVFEILNAIHRGKRASVNKSFSLDDEIEDRQNP